MKLSAFIMILIIISIPVFIFINVYQVYAYQRLEKEISILEAEQKEWVEKNKRSVAGIAVLSSPGRIDRLAEKEFGLSKIKPGRILRIEIKRDGSVSDEL
jgi:cell division protein FtsL